MFKIIWYSLNVNQKALGIMIALNLRFKSHITSLIRKSYSSLKLLYENRSIFNNNIKNYFVRVLFCSTLFLLYCLRSLFGTIWQYNSVCKRLFHYRRGYLIWSGRTVGCEWLAAWSFTLLALVIKLLICVSHHT